jgi:coenzyme F420 hydrogenase subunit delta
MMSDAFLKPIHIYGCGNPLIGDDGFGPRCIEFLTDHFMLPPSVLAEDVGTGVCDLLFDLILTPDKPSHLFLIDTVILPDRTPGELFEIGLDMIPVQNNTEFSLHQFPSVNLLWEIKNSTCIDVRVFAVQAKHIPQSIAPGLSIEVEKAIEPACHWLKQEVEAILSQ